MTLRALRVAWALGLLAFSALLFLHYLHRIDPRVELAYSQELRKLEVLHRELDADVLEERYMHHYDNIVGALSELEATERALERPPRFLSDEARAELGKKLEECEAATREKSQRVEAFKSATSVLRNSSRYVPEAAEHLVERLEKDGADAKTADSIKGMLADVLLYELSPSDARARRVTDRVEAFRATTAPWPEGAARAEADILVNHVRQIAKMMPRASEAIREILRIDAAQRAYELGSIYERHYRVALNDSDSRRSALFAVALLVLGLGATEIITRQRLTEAALRDATKSLRRANVALEKEKAREKELNELKSRFVSMTSHEFRTPLSVIRSSAELLASYWKRWDENKRGEHLTRIQASTKVMSKLLEGVLIVGKADAGKLEFRPAPIDVEEFCVEIADEVREGFTDPPAIERRFRGAKSTAVVDARLLRHVLQNLLSNAIKYGREGATVELDVDRGDDEIVFVVKDRGIGIPSDDLPHLFESFHRGSNVGTIPGTGLGLAVVKRSVERHGGSIEVKSVEGEGTTFVVRIPVGRQEASDADEAAEARSDREEISTENGGTA